MALEVGQDPIPLVSGSYVLDFTAGRLYLEAWTQDRTLSRRITGVVESKQNRLQLSIEKFGKREGLIELIDIAAPRSVNVTRKSFPPDLS